MRSAVPHLIFSLLYVAGVTWWGPQYMSTRKAVSGIRPYMMAYNAFQVIFSAYMFIEVGLHLTQLHFIIIFEENDLLEETNMFLMTHYH